MKRSRWFRRARTAGNDEPRSDTTEQMLNKSATVAIALLTGILLEVGIHAVSGRREAGTALSSGRLDFHWRWRSPSSWAGDRKARTGCGRWPSRRARC